MISLEVYLPILTDCGLSWRKSRIHMHRDLSTPMWISLLNSFRGMIVLNAELKSTNSTLAYVPEVSRCCRM